MSRDCTEPSLGFAGVSDPTSGEHRLPRYPTHTTKDHASKQRASSQTVRAVHTTRNFTRCEKTRYGLVAGAEDAAFWVDLETTHGVMKDGSHDGDVEDVVHCEVTVLEELLAEGILLRLCARQRSR